MGELAIVFDHDLRTVSRPCAYLIHFCLTYLVHVGLGHSLGV